MADTDELKAARIDGDLDEGPELITKWSALEATFRHIFTISADTDYSEAMSIGTGPNVTMTGTLTLPSGDPTTDLMAASKQYFGGIGNNFGAIRSRAYLTSDQTLATNTTHYIEFDAADINDGGMWSGVTPSRLTVPTGQGGHYIFGASLSWNDSADDAIASVHLTTNRSDHHRLRYEEQGLSVEYGFSRLMFLWDLSAGDFVELRFRPESANDAVLYSANTTFFGFRVN
jgi:hypothetical protein